jgi:hypothetical protein
MEKMFVCSQPVYSKPASYQPHVAISSTSTKELPAILWTIWVPLSRELRTLTMKIRQVLKTKREMIKRMIPIIMSLRSGKFNRNPQN